MSDQQVEIHNACANIYSPLGASVVIVGIVKKVKLTAKSYSEPVNVLQNKDYK